MQADMRLISSTSHGRCPLCNTPLTHKGTSQSQQTMVMCSSCGYSAPFVQRQQAEASNAGPRRSTAAGSSVWIDPAVSAYLGERIIDTASTMSRADPLHMKTHANPTTPIPHRASALSADSQAVKVRPKYPRQHTLTRDDADSTGIPILPPPPMWQYETPRFEAESSLPALTLVTDLPTRPETPVLPQVEMHVSNAHETKTPPSKQNQNLSDIDEIDTLPAMLARPPAPLKKQADQASSLVIMPAAPQPLIIPQPEQVDQRTPITTKANEFLASWTAGGAAASDYARRIAERTKKPRQRTRFSPLDHLRWWLLHPGRIEFLLWLGGSILLVSITFVLLLVTALSFAWIPPELAPQATSTPTYGNTTGGNHSTNQTLVVTSGSLRVELLNTGPLVPGQPLEVSGSGFSPQGNVSFTDEKQQPILILNSQSNTLQTDTVGAFTTPLNTSSWAAGEHLLVVRDKRTGQSLQMPIILASGPFGKNATPTPGHPAPGVTPTPTQNNGGGGAFPTPVGSTPVPVTPSPTSVPSTPTPRPTQPPPTPTPTVGITPTPTPITTPTVGTSPTPGNSPAIGTTPSPISSPTSNNTGMPPIAANVSAASIHGNVQFPTWSWLLAVGYGLAILLLGLAGLLRRRSRM